MQNNYIIKINNDILSFYYGENRSIYCKKLTQNSYPITTKIIENVTDYFTVDISSSDEIYIFCQTYEGDVLLCKIDNIGVKQKTIFKNKNYTPENILFYPLFLKDNMSIIYNSQGKNGIDFISIKTLIGGKNWSNTENIDIFTPIQNSVFHIQKVNDNNIILAYQKKGKDLQIGYKQILNGNISDFLVMHKTGYQVVDYSFVYFNDTIHYIYIIKSIFSTQVIYRKKDERNLYNPLVIFEGQKIKNCNIFVVDNKLYCSFIANNGLYYCISNDFGSSFLPINKYKKYVSNDIIKAKYISNEKSNINSINEVYLDAKNMINVYFLTDFYNNHTEYKEKDENFNLPYNENKNNFIKNLENQGMFYNTQSENYVNEQNQPSLNRNFNTKNNQIKALQDDFMSNFNIDEFVYFNETIKLENKNNLLDKSLNKQSSFESEDIMQNKFKMLSEQLVDKDKQIFQLNSIIQNKKNDNIEREKMLLQKIKKMEEENNILLKKINTFQENNVKTEIKESEKESEEIKIDEENINKDEKNK